MWQVFASYATICGMKLTDEARDAAWAALLRAIAEHGAASAEWGSESGAYASGAKRAVAFSKVTDLVDVLVRDEGGSPRAVRELAWRRRRP